MSDEKKPKVGRWLRVGLSAAIVPTMLVSLVAFERTDTGAPTVTASDSLELIRSQRQKTKAPPPDSGLQSEAPAPTTPVAETDASSEARAATNELRAAVSEANEAKKDRKRCVKATRRVDRAIRNAKQALKRQDELPDSVRRALLDALNDALAASAQVRRACRNPSGALPQSNASNESTSPVT